MTMEDRARTIFNIFKEYGFSDISNVAMIGNLQHESGLKPDVTEVGGFGGYGLAQWTPKENLYTQGSALGYTRQQCEQLDVQARIIAQATTVGQWTNAMSSNYDTPERISPLLFEDFKKMTNLESATVNFMGHYLRPTYKSADNKIYTQRIPYAKNWKKILVDGSTVPDPDPDPDIPSDDYEGIDIVKFIKEIKTLINKMLSTDLYLMGSSGFYKNDYLKLTKQLENTYKIKGTEKLFIELDKKFDDFNNEYVPPVDPNPDPDPDPDPPNDDMYFPVDTRKAGINFWKRSKWGVGTLQRNMTYGKRSTGVFHAGYDIGAGGNTGYKIFAVRSGTVTHVETRSTAGYVIAIKHDSDEYHTLYMHLVTGSNTVNVGDKVQAGQHIATMGNTGGNYAVHLHIELSKTGQFHKAETTENPETYLKVTNDHKTSLKIPQ